MQQALTAPVFKSLALAGLVLGVGIAAVPSTSSPPTMHRLKLHAEDAPNAVYLTVFHRGDIRVSFDGTAREAITFKTRATVFGCRALGIETLVPRDAHSFDYDYREKIFECDPDAPEVVKTPRKGIVTIED